VVSSGGVQSVLSGGTAIATAVLNRGEMDVHLSGFATGTTVGSGGHAYV
jgi:autotransporter passenger strand-loop-strand repeat protein